MPKAIVFDLDGTLADTSACIVGAAQYVRQIQGLRAVTDESIRSKIGQPLGFMLATLFDIDGSRLEQAVRDYSTEYVRLATIEERLFDGVISLLRDLREADFKLAVATGKSQNGADRSTARLGLTPWFDSIHGIVPGTPGKPDPAVLLRAMDALGVSASNCIMVGDTTFDLDLAHAVGVRTAAVDWGVHSREELLSRNPAFMALDFASLQHWLLAQATS
jgi:phosphoglycolate phosphatase